MVELVDLVDEGDRVIGCITRKACHGNPALIHRAVHILVLNAAEEVLLQLRGKAKEIQPGKWDTSVGGHVRAGERYEEAAARELEEELGIPSGELTRVHDYLWQSPVETERVRTFLLLHDGPFQIQEGEIEEARFWSFPSVEAHLETGLFTPNFEEEWARFLRWRASR